MIDLENLKGIISDIPFVNKVYTVEKKDVIIYGKVQILFDGLNKELDFTFKIFPQYPLTHHDSESITFYNQDLIELNHVMKNGSICIHTSHHTDLKQKIAIDFNSLKQWIDKYYINNKKDMNYEHIVVEENLLDESYYSYIFTEVDYSFKKGDFGEVQVSELNKSIYKEKTIQNYLVQDFRLKNKIIECKWSSFYKSYHKSIGLFYFTKEHPAKYNRFIFENWNNFKELISTDFLNDLHQFEKRNLKKNKGDIVPLFLGYETVNDEKHWQVALLKIGSFPIKGEAEILFGAKTGKWNSKLIKENINWALTRDSSYKYFFGRGTLSNKITDSKILIIGVGAIGSIVAKTLTKGGCRDIDIVDYDIKEPENVCRSEYMFQFGLNDKVIELQQLLSAISPFIDVNLLKHEYFESLIKTFHKDNDGEVAFTQNLNEYDIVFDCSTDNDLMYILDSLKLDCNIINLSITNHAKELVCAFYPNIYNFVNIQFNDILDNDLVDLYEPIGCWSPTFKASYNDIDLLVQVGMKHINGLFNEEVKKNNFVVTTNSNKILDIKIQEY